VDLCVFDVDVIKKTFNQNQIFFCPVEWFGVVVDKGLIMTKRLNEGNCK
jgi:hypothetical protein